MDTAAELRTTSDMLLLDLQTLGELEEQKRDTQHGDPRLTDLAAKIEELAQRVLATSRRQRELSETVIEAVEAGQAEAEASIAATRSASVILSDWRDAERAAREAPPGSAEESRAWEMVDRFRDEYRKAFEAARRELR